MTATWIEETGLLPALHWALTLESPTTTKTRAARARPTGPCGRASRSGAKVLGRKSGASPASAQRMMAEGGDRVRENLLCGAEKSVFGKSGS